MAVKREYDIVYISSTNRVGTTKSFRAGASSFKKFLKEVPKRTYKKIPQTVYANVSKQIRRFWKDNYEGKIGWELNSNTPRGAAIKNLYNNRGETFDLAPAFGMLKAKYRGNSFGLRTGNLYESIGSAKGTEATVRTSSEDFGGDRRGFDVAIQTRFKTERFHGSDNMRYPRGDVESGVPVSRPGALNYAEAFSEMITPPDERYSSVLIALSPDQLDRIRKYLRKSWSVEIKDVVQTELIPKLTKAI